MTDVRDGIPPVEPNRSLCEFRRPEDGLPPGTLVIERYEWEKPSGVKGVQWLAQIVDSDGDLALMKACKTKREALQVAGQRGVRV